MKLKRVEIYGFKSFAQRTELTFDQGITGIVGPNGSGKSNIADAVRWVLGEQSAKILRGSRMEDVIFNGTLTRKPLPYCEVSLQFDNEDGALNSPYAEVLVTRRAYRNGEGEYYLNKVNCRLRDILELFRDTGIGKEGYSIIGQGRIEEILSNRGEERRQVFEEAAGIVTYRVRKEEAERKLEKTRANLLRVNDLLEELASRLEPLGEQAKTARAYLSLSEQLKALEINVFLVRHDRLSERLASLAAISDTLRESIALQEQHLGEFTRERGAVEELLEQAEQAERAARQQEIAAQEDAYAKQTAWQRLKDQLKQYSEEMEKNLVERSKLESKLRDFEALLGEGEVNSRQSEERHEAMTQMLHAEDESLQNLLESARQAEEELDAHRQQIVEALNRLSDSKTTQARQQAMLAQIEKRSEEIGLEHSGLFQKHRQLQESTRVMQQAEEDAQAAVKALLADQNKLAQSSQDARAALEEQTRQQQTVSSLLLEKGNRLHMLEDLARDYEGYNLAVKRALQFAANKPGVFGAVAQLMQVPEEYETAIEMILGGALQHIITADEETAKAIIDHLRNNRLGRTTFLPLTAIRGRVLSQQERALLGAQGCLGVASELVTYDKRFEGIIQNLLGRTVIVRDLDCAIALSRQSGQAFHVVTLAGDVMRAGGAMTGGTTQGKTISLLGREREITELRSVVNVLQTDLEEMIVGRERLAQQYASLVTLQEEAAERVNQEQILLAREQERSRNAQADEQEAWTRLQALQSAMAQMEQAKEEIERDLSTASVSLQHLDMNREALEQKTVELQQTLAQARKLADEQREKVSVLQLQQSEQKHQLDMLSRDHARLEKEIATSKGLLQESHASEAELKNAVQQATAALESHEAAAADAQSQLKALRSTVNQLESERADLQKRQKAYMDQAESAHQLHSTQSEKLHRNELVIARTENELQTMNDHMFNTYTLTYALAEPMRQTEKLELPRAEQQIQSLKKQIREMGVVNVNAIEDYSITKQRYEDLDTQRNDAQRAESDLVDLIARLLKQMESQFVTEFEKLNQYFKETFARLFGGGHANLILSNPDEPLTCTIEVAAQPPGKKLQLLSLLSGGERALTAIAILFAMLKLKPTPFCVLDEIEAALDDANISYFADYLSEYAKSTQFVVITHRKGTMERCDTLYGVSMEEKGVSSMVSVDLYNYA